MESLLFRPASTQKRRQRRRKFTSIGIRKRKCDFCPSTEATYTCPQCDLPFCSAECFRTEKHRQCSELFYKKCVLEHLKHTKTDKTEQARFLEILKRNSAATNEDITDYLDLVKGGDNNLESINLDVLTNPRLQQFSEKLTSRLASTNDALDPETIWQELNEDEQVEFIGIVQSNGKLFDEWISQWRPWWWRREWQVAVEEVQQEDEDDEDDEENSKSFPVFFGQFERISKLTSKTPSPTIGPAILCTAFAYCHLTRLYNGEIACCTPPPEESSQPDPRWTADIATELFRLCPFLDAQHATKINPESPSEALRLSLSCLLGGKEEEELATKKLVAIELLGDLKILFDFLTSPGRVLIIRDDELQQDSSAIHRAPKAILLVLSDLIHILAQVQHQCKLKNNRSLAKRIELAKRKLQFYLSWSVEYGERVLGGKELLVAIELEMTTLKQERLLFEAEREEVLQEEVEVKSSNKTVHFSGPMVEEIN